MAKGIEGYQARDHKTHGPQADAHRRHPAEGGAVQKRMANPGDMARSRTARKKWFNNWRHAEEFAAKENKRLELLKEKGAGRYTFNDAADSYIKEREHRSKAKDNTGMHARHVHHPAGHHRESPEAQVRAHAAY